MKAFTVVTGVAAPMDRANVDTDLITPKQMVERFLHGGEKQTRILVALGVRQLARCLDEAVVLPLPVVGHGANVLRRDEWARCRRTGSSV